MTRPPNTARVSRFASIALPISFLLLTLRGWRSLDRIPADPGYGWVLRASREGLPSVLASDPYFRLHELSVAWIVSLFPIATHAVLLSILSHFAWALGATVTAWWTLKTVRSVPMAILVGMLVVFAPHAAESVLGNHGNVRWILLIMLVTIVSAPPELRSRGFGVGLLAFVNGLSNPVAGISLLPLVIRSGIERRVHPRDLALGGWLAVGVVIQLIQAFTNGFLGGYNTKTSMPWDNMGFFWWSGLLGPLAASAATLLLVLIGKRRDVAGLEFPLFITISALATHAASYLLGGIADRYFVAPMTLTLVSFVLAVHLLSGRHRRLRRFSFLIFLVMATVPTSKWFSSSSYLASGPEWSAEVRRARSLCEIDQKSILDISLSPHGTQRLTCNDIS